MRVWDKKSVAVKWEPESSKNMKLDSNYSNKDETLQKCIVNRQMYDFKSHK